VREPVKRPERVLKYLARYTHRVAIANSRITALNDGMMTFKIKNRKENRKEQITIPAVEFIRRFLLHSLPKRFVRIRHYGFLANRYRSKNINAIRQLMGLSDLPEKQIASVEEMIVQRSRYGLASMPMLHSVLHARCPTGLSHEVPLFFMAGSAKPFRLARPKAVVSLKNNLSQIY
jgi:hypothetical protein